MGSSKDVSQYSDQSKAGSTEDVDDQSISAFIRGGSGSASDDQSNTSDVSVSSDEHRNMILASLLEDYYRSRAAEFLNTANPGKNYTRQSQEVQPLARQLFSQATRQLVSNGLLGLHATLENVQEKRLQYLIGLDHLGAGVQAPPSNVLNPKGDLAVQMSNLSLMSLPEPGLQLAETRIRSHYQASFVEGALIGKGGFGKVYQCYSPLDQKTYAVKKIPLSPRLGKRFSEGRHEELKHILGEVQALAKLDHPNVVRYHATWYEPPQKVPNLQGVHMSVPPGQRKLLLDNRAFSENTDTQSQQSFGIVFGEDTASFFDSNKHPQASGGIVFEEDTASFSASNRKPEDSFGIVFGEDSAPDDQKLSANGPEWSEKATSDQDSADQTTYASGSGSTDIFTDGKSRSIVGGQQHQPAPMPDGYVLYVQMSMYPTTLAKYLSSSSSQNATPRHCFHLIPTLHLLLCILAGLQYIHDQGLVHRDIKPGNIFLSSSEKSVQGGYCDVSCHSCSESPPGRWLNARIGDFGLVAQLAHGEVPNPISAEVAKEDNAPQSQKPVGTAYYRPPPRKGKSVDNEKVDIFALGVVFVEMLCPCSTAMERVDMLKGLQKGDLPAVFVKGMEKEDYGKEVIEAVVELGKAMVNPDPQERWSGPYIEKAARGILSQCDDRT